MNNKLLKRFIELSEQSDAISKTQRVVTTGQSRRDVVDGELLLNWRVKVRNLLNAACGPTSEHMKTFENMETLKINFDTSLNLFKRLRPVFEAAKEDYEGGYLTSVEELVRAEVFDQELDQARELLANGYTAAGAVVAGVVLETTLRGLCNSRSVSLGSMERMNQDLTKAGVYTVLVQKQVTAMAHIRNKAAHGETEQYTDADVRKMVVDVGDFVAKHVGV